MKEAIVIGAGLGGLATAVRLQRQGFHTTVLEKNTRAGGRCDRWQQDGFTFDTGPTILLMVDALREVFSAVGRDIREYLDLIRLPFNYRIRFGDGSFLDVSHDQVAMRRQLEAIEPGAGAAYLRFLEDAGRKYRIARARFTDRNFRNWAEYLTPVNLYYLLRSHALQKLEPFAARHFHDPRLRLAFTFQTMYLGLPPAAAPAIYALLPYTEIVDGIWYPSGGMFSIPLALARLLEELGGEIRMQSPVQEILVRQRRAAGVRLADGTALRADVVVCNADLPQSYATLVPPGFRTPYERGRLDQLRYGCSTFMLYLGVDTTYDDLFHHNVFLAADTGANFDQIFKQHRLPDDPSLYIHCATGVEPAMAPAGCSTLSILVPVPHLGGAVQWPIDAPAFRDRVLARVESLAAPQLRRRIVVEHMITPLDWAREYGLRHGATFGLAHDLFQVGYMRPRNKARGVDRLYFVGASTVPGGGVPMTLIGSRLVTERVLHDVGHA